MPFRLSEDVPISEIDAPAVRDALAAIWLTKPETARRLRQRIVTVIDWAVAKGYRDNPLPMAVIDKALPRQRAKPKHHAALPYADLPAFMAGLRERESMGRLALEAVILTAARSGEMRLATWSELDLENALWTIPAERMKAGREHVVPLSPQAVALFERMKKHHRGGSELVFQGTKRGKPLSDMTLTKVLRDMDLSVTAHGFPFNLPRLGCGTNELSERCSRSGACSCYLRQDGCSISARYDAGEAARTHDRMGKLLRWSGNPQCRVAAWLEAGNERAPAATTNLNLTIEPGSTTVFRKSRGTRN